jgi:hypothetical protein
MENKYDQDDIDMFNNPHLNRMILKYKILRFFLGEKLAYKIMQKWKR